MTIHHTGVVLGDNRNAPARLRQHQQLHQNDRGWIDIAYHVGIDRNGNIYELRDPGIKGDTATGGTKPATLETGLIFAVPLFVNIGDTLKVDTRTGDYLERVY